MVPILLKFVFTCEKWLKRDHQTHRYTCHFEQCVFLQIMSVTRLLTEYGKHKATQTLMLTDIRRLRSLGMGKVALGIDKEIWENKKMEQ